MENSRQTGSHFPPGFRFHPTDQELINHYLKKKVASSLPPAWAIITEVDLYKFNPWELPEKALFGEKEWFFFSPRDRKYPNGVRPNRSAGSGYWKATGIDKPILATDGIQCIGVKKALIFYQGHPSKGTKTQWVMHEYRLLNSTLPYQAKKLRNSMRLDDWVLCRIKKKGAVETEGLQVPVSLKPSPPAINNSQQVNQQVLGIEQNSVFEWSDTQLFSYLIGSLENGEISVGGESDSCSNTRGSNHGEHFENFEVQLQSPQLDTTAYSSMKKRLGSAMDELMEMPARKRFECSNDEQCFWLEDIFALDQGLMEFL